jgi:hypothetical protein
MIFISQHLIKKRRRIQNIYRCFLIVFILFATLFMRFITNAWPVFWIFVFFLLLFELKSKKFGRKNVFGGHLTLDDHFKTTTKLTVDIAKPDFSHGPIYFDFNKEFAYAFLIIIILIVLLPLSGYIKEIVMWGKYKITPFHLLPFFSIVLIAIFAKSYLSQIIKVNHTEIIIHSIFNKTTIRFDNLLCVCLVDLKSYIRRYTTYIEFQEKNRVRRLPIESINNFKKFKPLIEEIVGYEINYL